ncbi:unnamed protein product [Dicrocoelium dendriticum]|nr:unnamed protein product [Dicrocoelium dendriticum]
MKCSSVLCQEILRYFDHALAPSQLKQEVPLSTTPEPDPVPTFPPVDASEMAGDDDPLGSDDIVMRTKFTRKFQRNGPPPPVRSSRGRSHGSFRGTEFRGNRKSSGTIPKQLSRHPLPKDKARRHADSVLHPSWQAKREQKLKAKLHSVNPAPTAMHIIFAD